MVMFYSYLSLPEGNISTWEGSENLMENPTTRTVRDTLGMARRRWTVEWAAKCKVYVIMFITGDNNFDGYNVIITCYDHLL